MKLAIEQTTQGDNDVKNDCLPANIAALRNMPLNEVLDKLPEKQRGRPLPIWHQDPLVMDLYGLLRACGLPYRYSGGLNALIVRGWLSQRLPIILLIGYSGMGEYRQIVWEGDHYITAVGFTDDAVLIHDPLGIHGAGSYVAVPDEVLDKAMSNMDWPGNRGNQGVIITRRYAVVDEVDETAVDLLQLENEIEALKAENKRLREQIGLWQAANRRLHGPL